MWSTPIQVFNNGYQDPFERYKDFLKDHYKLDLNDFKYDIREWKTTPGSGYWMSPHNHGHSHFTSIYYNHVSGEGGELILHDPRVNANRGFPQEFGTEFAPYIIQPKTGMTVIFPSYVYHTAAPFRGIIREASVSEIQLASISTGDSYLGATSI